MIHNVVRLTKGESKIMGQIDSVVQAAIESKETGEHGECLVFVATMEQAFDIAMPYKDEKVIF
jgi:nitrogen regulatory protein PII